MDNDGALAQMLAELAASLEQADRMADGGACSDAWGPHRLTGGAPGTEASAPCAG